MNILDRQTARVLATILLFAAVLGILYVARQVVAIFLFAILLAYLINPVVRFLQRHSLFFKNLRGPHILEAYVAFLAVIALLIYGLAPGLFGQTASLTKQMPTIVDGLTTGEIATALGGRYGWSDEQTGRLKSFLVQHRTNIQSFLAATERLVPTVVGSLILIPVLAIFFLSEGPGLAKSLIGALARVGNRVAIENFTSELNRMLQHYIRAKVTLGFLSFVYCSLTLLILGFPHALGLGVLAGILEFIPILGWMLSATTILSIGAFTHSHWIWMAALLGIWRFSMDYFISPRVFGRELEIPPLLAIFTLMVGGAVGGIVGIYLSIPLMGALHLVWNSLNPSTVAVAVPATTNVAAAPLSPTASSEELTAAVLPSSDID